MEATGYHAEIIGRVPGTFQGATGPNVYFLMRPIGPQDAFEYSECKPVRWATPSEAQTLIDHTIAKIGRRRASDVLEAAVTAFGQARPASHAVDSAEQGGAESEAPRRDDFSRFVRRLLRMVRELHHRGYERLRFEPGLSASGMNWRCAIAPAEFFSAECGARLTPPFRHMYWKSERPLIARYTTGMGYDCFGWGDCSEYSPSELADRFQREFPQILELTRGADPDYVQWYADMLVHTDPLGAPIAYADWKLRNDMIEVLGHPDVLTIPLPPPVLS
jgi:hypothetical protein